MGIPPEKLKATIGEYWAGVEGYIKKNCDYELQIADVYIEHRDSMYDI